MHIPPAFVGGEFITCDVVDYSKKAAVVSSELHKYPVRRKSGGIRFIVIPKPDKSLFGPAN
jgi:hypothetical protein